MGKNEPQLQRTSKAAKAPSKEQFKGALKPAKQELQFDKTQCCGCRLCEVACTQYHEGDANPLTIRCDHVVRPVLPFADISGFNANAPGWPQPMSEVIFAEYSEHSFCKQCISPECLFVCPTQAVSLHPETRARVVDEEKCNGCGLCVKKCLWGMMKMNPETKKAVKCDLCDGKPQCVEWCPTDAITIKEMS